MTEGKEWKLDFPEYPFRTRTEAGRREIFDPVRRRFVALTPEEWVRQHVIRYLAEEKSVPLSLMAVEKSLVVNRLSRRCDLLVHNNSGKAVMMVECKAPGVKLSQSTFEQIARYNMALQLPWLWISNGHSHYCCRIDHGKGTIAFSAEVPSWERLSGENV